MSDEDLHGPWEDPSKSRSEKFGFYQDPLAKYNGGPGASPGQTYNPRAWGGLGYQYDENGKAIDGTTGAERDVTKFRDRGAQRRDAIQLDPRAAVATDAQVGSLAMLSNAARGNAPSQAVAQGQIAASDAMRAQMAAAGSAQGGPGAQIAMMRGSLAGSAMGMGNAAAQTMNGRAGEMVQNMGQYSAGAGTIRGQDQQVASTNASLVAQQRALDQQRRQAYEKMAWDTRNAEMGAQNEADNQDSAQALALRQQRNAEHQQDINKATDIAKIGLGAAMGLSDRRAKEDIHPMGSLSGLMRR